MNSEQNEYMDICEQLIRDLATARAWNKSLGTAYEALWKEKKLMLSVLEDWLEFSKDSFVTANEREFGRLRELEARTVRIVEPCSGPVTLPCNRRITTPR